MFKKFYLLPGLLCFFLGVISSNAQLSNNAFNLDNDYGDLMMRRYISGDLTWKRALVVSSTEKLIINYNGNFTDGSRIMGNRLHVDGDVGIGTGSPLGKLHVSTSTSGDAIFRLEADTDNNNEADNPLIQLRQDGGAVGVNLGFADNEFGSNIFGIGTRYVNQDNWQAFVINTQNGNVGIGTLSPSGKLEIKGDDGEQSQGQIHLVGNGGNGSGDAYISFHEGSEANSKWSIGVKDHDNAFSISHGLTMDAAPKLVVKDNTGYVGIGTTDPLGKLQIKGESGEQQQGQIHVVGNGESGSGDAYISFHEGSEVNSKWSVGVKDHDNAFSISHGLTMDSAPKLIIKDVTGDVGIGTNSPDAKLAVNGNIHAKEVKVDLVGWPDYVFEEDYDLPTLEEVQDHIKETGHLINMPSASEVESDGLELGEMNKLLLEKIEELTLYVLQLKNEINQLKNE